MKPEAYVALLDDDFLVVVDIDAGLQVTLVNLDALQVIEIGILSNGGLLDAVYCLLKFKLVIDCKIKYFVLKKK